MKWAKTDRPLGIETLDTLSKVVREMTNPRKIVGICVLPRFNQNLTIDDWFIVGVVTEPCSFSDPGRLL